MQSTELTNFSLNKKGTQTSIKTAKLGGPKEKFIQRPPPDPKSSNKVIRLRNAYLRNDSKQKGDKRERLRIRRSVDGTNELKKVPNTLQVSRRRLPSIALEPQLQTQSPRSPHSSTSIEHSYLLKSPVHQLSFNRLQPSFVLPVDSKQPVVVTNSKEQIRFAQSLKKVQQFFNKNTGRTGSKKGAEPVVEPRNFDLENILAGSGQLVRPFLIEPVAQEQIKKPQLSLQQMMQSLRATQGQILEEEIQFKRYADGVYLGEMKNGLKEGRGILFYSNGRKFQGQFEADLREGTGKESYPNGAVYTGKFHKGLRHGNGRFVWPNGQSYDGQWNGGYKHGSGMWKGSRGDSYIGQWVKDKVEGFGVHTYANGDRYQGQFRDFCKSGNGTQRFSNGDVFVGVYCKGKANGPGFYYWKQGAQFEGQFKNGLRHGRGLFRNNKQVYQGEYINDKMSGLGSFTDKYGNFYQGQFQNGLKHGYGTINFNSGVVFQGYWINDKPVQAPEQVVYAYDKLAKAKPKILVIRPSQNTNFGGGNNQSHSPRKSPQKNNKKKFNVVNPQKNKKQQLKDPSPAKEHTKVIQKKPKQFIRRIVKQNEAKRKERLSLYEAGKSKHRYEPRSSSKKKAKSPQLGEAEGGRKCACCSSKSRSKGKSH